MEHFPTRRSLRVFLLTMAVLVLIASLGAADTLDKDYFAGLKARAIGPAGMSGRIAAVDVALSDPRIMYVGTATGGVWKSINGGITWKPIFDDQPVSSAGDVTIDSDNPEVVWVGTGEANPRNSVGVGRGVYKTLNGGQSWMFLGLEKTEKISRLLLDPNHPDTAFVAAMGTTWGENQERGIFKTMDGGKTWKKVLYVDEKTGAADLEMDPRNPNRLLAAMWEHRRWPWFFNSGGPGSGLYLSVDGGETWKKLTHEDGLPKGNLGRIGLAFSRSNPDVVYALVEAEKSALCRSEDGGNKWKIVNDKPGVSPRPFYYSDIRVHPQKENTVYRLSSPLDVSIDGGKTFSRLMPFFSIHGDFHELWIHPEDGEMMVVGGDGGIGISYDGGKHWNFVQNLPLAQYYHISVDMEQPYNIYGGMQDNGSWVGPSQIFAGQGIMNFHWQTVGGGDGFGTLAIPTESSLGYSMWQGGNLMRYNLKTGEQKDIRPPDPEGVKLRFHWNSAIAVDPHDPKTVYYGSQFLHKSSDQGQSWEIISPDLTTDDPEKQKQAESGGLTKDVTNAENHCTILTVAPSPVQKGIIWVGSDDGKIHLTQDGGKSWQDLTVKLTGGKEAPVPAGTWIPHVEASPHEAGAAYVVFDDHRRANWKTYVFMTQDYGKTWKDLATPDIDGFVHVIREDPVQKNLLFLGTEFGLYLSFDRGRSWMKWSNGFPTAPVRDLAVHPRDHDLIIGTHGRSAYILDDIQCLREHADEIMAKNVHIFPVADAYQFRTNFMGRGYLAPGDMEFKGENRKYGALITYSLGEVQENKEKEGEEGEKKDKDDSIKIEILDSEGKLVRSLKGPKEKGLNRTNWDLRHDAFKSLRGEESFFYPERGPYVLPGKYTVRIKLAENVVENPVQVYGDPRDSVPVAARQAKHGLQMKTGAYVDTAVTAYQSIEKALKAIEEVAKRKDSIEDSQREDILSRGKTLKEKLKNIADRIAPPKDRSGIFAENELYSRLSTLSYRLDSSFDAPTAGQLQEFKQLKALVKQEVVEVNQVIQEEFLAFFQKVESLGVSLFPKIEPIDIKE